MRPRVMLTIVVCVVQEETYHPKRLMLTIAYVRVILAETLLPKKVMLTIAVGVTQTET